MLNDILKAGYKEQKLCVFFIADAFELILSQLIYKKTFGSLLLKVNPVKMELHSIRNFIIFDQFNDLFGKIMWRTEGSPKVPYVKLKLYDSL